MGCCFAKMKVMFKMSVLLFKFYIVVVLLVMGNWSSRWKLLKDEVGSRASSIWGAAPDKYGKWNCRCFGHFMNNFRHWLSRTFERKKLSCWSGILKLVQGSGSWLTPSGNIRQNRKVFQEKSWPGTAPWDWRGSRRLWRTKSTLSKCTSPLLATSRFSESDHLTK